MNRIAQAAHLAGAAALLLLVPDPSAAQLDAAALTDLRVSGAIRIGETIADSITASDEGLGDGSRLDLWTFRGSEGDTLTIELRSDDFDAYLVLLRMDGDEGAEVLMENDDGGADDDSETDARIVTVLPATGSYTIAANTYAKDEEGAYRLSLWLTPGAKLTVADESSTPPIAEVPVTGTTAPGRTVEGTLEEGDTKLWDGSWFEVWLLEGREGETVVITLESADFDAFLQLYHGNDFVADDDDGAREGGSDSRLEVTFPATGSYRIVVNTYDEGGTGSYRLRVTSP